MSLPSKLQASDRLLALKEASHSAVDSLFSLLYRKSAENQIPKQTKIPRHCADGVMSGEEEYHAANVYSVFMD